MSLEYRLKFLLGLNLSLNQICQEQPNKENMLLNLSLIKTLSKVTRQVRWNSLPRRYIKINVDVGNPGNADFGGLLRNDRGNWIQGFFGSCGRASNLLTELSAI